MQSSWDGWSAIKYFSLDFAQGIPQQLSMLKMVVQVIVHIALSDPCKKLSTVIKIWYLGHLMTKSRSLYYLFMLCHWGLTATEDLLNFYHVIPNEKSWIYSNSVKPVTFIVSMAVYFSKIYVTSSKLSGYDKRFISWPFTLWNIHCLK